MDDLRLKSVEDRLDRLEALVADLRSVVGQMHVALLSRPDPGRAVPPLVLPSEARAGRPAAAPPSMRSPGGKRPDVLAGGESWLGRIGIGLLLLGVAFLFKYSVDRGWVGPMPRAGFGLLLGAGLLAAGLRLREDRPGFGRILQGGGVATFYITGFAAYHVLAIVGYPLAFGFMVATTILAFLLALRQGDAALSLIGALGGLATPFVLPTDSPSLAGLVAYTAVVLAGALAIDVARGWRSLLWTAFLGGWAILGTCVAHAIRDPDAGRGALQLGIAFAWLAFGTVPLIRDYLGWLDPTRWARAPADLLAGYLPLGLATTGGRRGLDAQDLAEGHAQVISFLGPILALAASLAIWSPTKMAGWGVLCLAVSALYGAAFVAMRRLAWFPAAAHGWAAVVLFTVALVLLLEPDALLVALALEGAALLWAGRRLEDDTVATPAGHLLFLGVGLWTLVRMAGRPTAPGAFDASEFANLVAIVVVAGASWAVRPREVAWAYRLVAHVGALGWLWRRFAVAPQGNAVVTITWGVYAVALLVVGLRFGRQMLTKVGLGTLLLAAAKLLIVDLAELDALWRILLFLGFGGLFLALGYSLPSLWRPARKPAGPAD